MAPLLKFQFAAHLTRFDGHQRRNQTSATMLGSSKILHWHSWKSSSGNPGILEGQIARMIIQGIHLKARHVSWSLGNQCKQQWHPSPFEQKIPASILDTHTRPPRINYYRSHLGNFSKVQDFTSLLAMLCHLKQLLIHQFRWCRPKVKNLL